MKKNALAGAVIACALAAGPGNAASLGAIDQIYAFGDSLNDCCRNPGAPFTNGPLTWLPDFAERVGGAYPVPETPAANYAVGGAQSGPVNAIPSTDTALGYLTGFTSQVSDFAATSPTIGADDLAVIWVSTNDIWASAYEGDLLFGALEFNRPIGKQPAAGALAAYIGEQIGAGLAGLEALGFTQALVLSPYDMSQAALWDTPGAQDLNGIYAAAIRDALVTLDTPGVDTAVLDMIAVLEEVQAGAPGNGFTNLNAAESCATLSDGVACDGFIFLDAVHFTTGMNAVIAQKAAALVAPIPVPAAGWVLLAGLGALAGLRRLA